MLFTYKDLTDHLLDYHGGTDEKDARDYRRAAIEALREVSDGFPWSYYVTSGRLNVTGPVSDGTVAYDATGGAYERLVTLSGSTWPSWAADGVIDLDGFRCEVDRVMDTTRLTLAARSCPPGDVAAGTTYELSRDSYPAPSDFVKPITELLTEGGCFGPAYIEPGRLGQNTLVRSFTVTGDPNYQGGSAFRFDPPPSEDTSYGYWYRRKPPALSVEGEAAGTLSVTADSATVTGTGTAFSAKHVGCVLRLSGDGTVPTGEAGANPASVERIVTDVASVTSLTVDAAYSATAAGRGFILSSPVDVADYMRDYLLRCAEYRLHFYRNRQEKFLPLALQEKVAAFKRSAAADSKGMGKRYVGRLPSDLSYRDDKTIY